MLKTEQGKKLKTNQRLMAKTDHIHLKIDLLDVKIDTVIHILNGINEDVYRIFGISESSYIFNGTFPS